ncbi:MAG: hypothetical protein KZQ76_11925 [Candidatus Thiodiazotropha sp. (ex Epidulcina cf. delphinae)]|nr:hypothetical protein [Candidatus Thiodiazotropha sp. (ex Epidulcina cf. delphinae)]
MGWYHDNRQSTRDHHALMNDTGRMSVTGKTGDKNPWRVPTLRNLAYTAPYMHTGTVKTLEDAVKVMAKTQLDKDLNDRKVADIAAFLDSLNGEFPVQTMPRLPVTPGGLLDEPWIFLMPPVDGPVVSRPPASLHP